MSNLAEKWSMDHRKRAYSMPTSVRLRPEVDARIQALIDEFPHLNQTQIINDLLMDSLERLKSIGR